MAISQSTTVSEPLGPGFWSRVQKSDGCWLWTGVIARRYGLYYWKGRLRRAHRLAYAEAYGPITAGIIVCHCCDTPACVRPDHLFLGTQADNLRDMREKGRSFSLLTAEQVQEIRRLRVPKGQIAKSRRVLAQRFGVSPLTIKAIQIGSKWKSLREEPTP